MNTSLSQDRSLRRHLYLDGLRYGVNMLSIAYTRLRTVLASISDTRKPEPGEFTSAFLDAWSIVDSAFRYRVMLTSMPGLKKNEPPMKVFLDKTKTLEDLRHYMQHPNSADHFQKVKDSTRPFMGILVWVRIYTEESARVCSLLAGSFPYTKGDIPAINPLGKTVEAPVDLVCLHVASSQICLSDLVRSVCKNYKDVSTQTEVKSMSDVFISMDLHTPSASPCPYAPGREK